MALVRDGLWNTASDVDKEPPLYCISSRLSYSIIGADPITQLLHGQARRQGRFGRFGRTAQATQRVRLKSSENYYNGYF